MATNKTDRLATVIAVYPDHASAEDAVRRLEKEGIPMKDLSIVGEDFQAIEKPLGFVTTGTAAREGAKVSACGRLDSRSILHGRMRCRHAWYYSPREEKTGRSSKRGFFGKVDPVRVAPDARGRPGHGSWHRLLLPWGAGA
jgi:hypothetical protein